MGIGDWLPSLLVAHYYYNNTAVAILKTADLGGILAEPSPALYRQGILREGRDHGIHGHPYNFCIGEPYFKIPQEAAMIAISTLNPCIFSAHSA